MKILKTLWIINIIFILFICFYLFIYSYINRKNIVIIPEIKSNNEEEIIKELNNLGLIVETKDGELDYYYTIPNSGINVYSNTKVILYRPIIKKDIYLSFVGQIYDGNIKKYFNNQNVYLDISYMESNRPKNTIISQEKIGEEIVKNETIKILLAKEYEYIKMPNIVGYDINDAIKILNNLNLEYRIVYFESIFDEDIVLYQEIESGSLIHKNNKSVIDIYVSKNTIN